MKTVIVAETGADIPKNIVEQYGLNIVPMHVAIEGKSLNDGEFPVTDVFDSYKKTKHLPTTSATNPEEYKTMFEQLRKNDPDCHILHLCYSAATTATYQNALIGGDGINLISHIDTKQVSGGQYVIVAKMAEYLKNNSDASIDAIKKEAAYWIDKARFAFFPGDLEYLKAGGRVSNAAYLAASLLGLKPLIEMIDGKLVGTKKYRGSTPNVCKRLVNEYLKENPLEKDSIFYVYSEGLDEGLKKELEEVAAEMGYPSITWIKTGCVISTHAGPGAFGIGGFALN